MSNTLISASILSADFMTMGETIKSIESVGCDFIHCDVMDGVFVPNISYGVKMVSDIKKISSIPLDVHLMITSPERYIDDFIRAGADYLVLHLEACKPLHKTLEKIKKQGIKCGVALSPDTQVSKLYDLLQIIDLALIMSVHPGFGGQSFIEGSINRISELKELCLKSNSNPLIEVDGGINERTAPLVKKAGADVLVTGSSLINAKDRAEFISNLKR